MTLDLDDTIAAIATASGGALRGIVRISGPAAETIVTQSFTPDSDEHPISQRLPTCLRGMFLLPRNLGPVPTTLYLWPTKSSYTRQPSAELHLPGSPPLLEAALEAVATPVLASPAPVNSRSAPSSLAGSI
jgi:tRNA modification GTPase